MTATDTVALLPCPWCGDEMGKPAVIEGSTFRWRVVAGCCTNGPEVRHDTLSDDQAAAEADSTRRAIEAWNRRAPNDELDAARRDAERYRWLRLHFRFANDNLRELWFDKLLAPNDSGVTADLDQEIDAAMAQDGEG